MPVAGAVYKNLKVMQATPNEEFLPDMRAFTGALGVSCEHCHETDRASDALPAKDIARQMITMTRELNRSSFDGAPAITCYTCHHGMQTPAKNPVVPVVFSDTLKQPKLPSADTILQHYLTAIGGEAAVKSTTSRRISGSENLPAGEGGLEAKLAAVQIEEAAPNLRVVRYGKAQSEEGFDGKTAWSKSANGACSATSSAEQANAARRADFYGASDLKKEFRRVVTTRTESIDGHDVFELTGTNPSQTPETFAFDARTGLLLRRTSYLHTEFGDLPFTTAYTDYRTLSSGEKIPFHRHMTPASPKSALSSSADLVIDHVDLNPVLKAEAFACIPNHGGHPDAQ